MSKKQKILIALIIIVLLLIIGFAAYYYFAKKGPVKIDNQGGQQNSASPSPQGGAQVIDARLRKISRGAALSPTTNTDGTRVLYVGKAGGIFESDFLGDNFKETKLVALQNLTSVLWSADRTSFIGIYTPPEGKKMIWYDIPTNKNTPYGSDMRAVSFSRTENKIAYHRFDAGMGAGAILVADPNTENARTAFPTRFKDVRLDFLSEDTVALSTAPSGFAPNILWTINPKTQKSFSVLSNVYGLTTLWSPSNEKVLFSQTGGDGKGLALSVANKDGSNIKRLAVATLPEKCVFSKNGESLVCVAPENTPDIVWPDDYYKKLYHEREQVWRVNTETGAKDLLYTFTDSFVVDATSLLLSPKENSLVFLNKKDGELYSLTLE